MLRLKELRKEKGITLKELSQILKERYNLIVSDGQLSNYENEKRRPRDESIWNDIADYFGVWVPYLLGNSKIRTEAQAEKLASANQRLNQSLEENPIAFTMEATEPDEHSLLYYYRQLEEPYKKRVNSYASDMFELQKELKDNTKTPPK